MSDRAECEAVVRQLWPFVDGYLDDADRERITRHLEGCDACRSHFDYAAEFLGAVAAAQPDPEMDMAELEQRVIRALTGSR
jgi:anti-sigma factor RsiW